MPRRSRSLFCFPVLFSLLTVDVAQASNILRQVHVIARHGSRFPALNDFPHPQNSLSSSSIPYGPLQDTLTPLGELQMYNLGLWLKERYAGKLNRNNTVTYFYQLDRVRFESSHADSTLLSAQAVALGFFDAAARDPYGENALPDGIRFRPNIPITTPNTAESNRNDVLFRAYDKCPTFDAKLKEKVYTGTEFQSLRVQYKDLCRNCHWFRNLHNFKTATTTTTKALPWNTFGRFATG